MFVGAVLLQFWIFFLIYMPGNEKLIHLFSLTKGASIIDYSERLNILFLFIKCVAVRITFYE